MPQRGALRMAEPNWEPGLSAFGLMTAKVIAVHPEDHTIDAVTVHGGIVMRAIVTTAWGGTDYGDVFAPQFTPDPGVSEAGLPAEGWRIAPQRQRDTYALIAYASGNSQLPFVLGFFYPDTSQMMHSNLQRLTRHVGDTFAAVSRDGSHWLAFSQDGSYVGFHSRDESRPPDLTGMDYDHRTATEPAIRHFTVMLANGATVAVDGESGNITIGAPRHLDLAAYGNADLFGAPLTLNGAHDFYLETPRFGGLCRAPFSEDATVAALNLTVNAAYDLALTMRERPALTGSRWAGWRYLRDGVASRSELGPDGRLRAWVAASGLQGEAITWTRPAPRYVDHFVSFHYSVVGKQSFLCPAEEFILTGYTSRGVGGVALWVNYSPASLPSEDAPVVLHAGDVCEVEALASVTAVIGGHIAVYGNRH